MSGIIASKHVCNSTGGEDVQTPTKMPAHRGNAYDGDVRVDDPACEEITREVGISGSGSGGPVREREAERGREILERERDTHTHTEEERQTDIAKPE